MIHGPYGRLKLKSPCMNDRICSKSIRDRCFKKLLPVSRKEHGI